MYIVLINPPYEPLYIQTNDGEASIPRRVFYDICKAYQPYKTMVISTFVRLLTTFAVVTVIFLLIIQFQVFDEFSEVRKFSFGGECNPVTDPESGWET